MYCNTDFLTKFTTQKTIARGWESEPSLKVPKHEIFNRSDFPDFYTMKSLRVGDLGVKIKQIFKNI